jgi:hypothetical protein
LIGPFLAAAARLLRAYQRDLNFSAAQPALSNAKRRAAKSGAVSGVERESPQSYWGREGMIGIDQTGRRARGAITAAIAISSSIVASAIMASTASFAVPRYDGLWSVSIVTEKGDCDRGYRYPIRISNGLLANAGSDVFTITGKVGGTGAITVTVSGGGRSATGSGRLAGNMGIGSWTGGSCSGSWTAERRGP